MKHPESIDAMRNLSFTYRGLGGYEEAESLGCQVLDMSKEVLGLNHHETVRAMANLADTYRE